MFFLGITTLMALFAISKFIDAVWLSFNFYLADRVLVQGPDNFLRTVSEAGKRSYPGKKEGHYNQMFPLCVAAAKKSQVGRLFYLSMTLAFAVFTIIVLTIPLDAYLHGNLDKIEVGLSIIITGLGGLGCFILVCMADFEVQRLEIGKYIDNEDKEIFWPLYFYSLGRILSKSDQCKDILEISGMLWSQSSNYWERYYYIDHLLYVYATSGPTGIAQDLLKDDKDDMFYPQRNKILTKLNKKGIEAAYAEIHRISGKRLLTEPSLTHTPISKFSDAIHQAVKIVSRVTA